MSTCLGLRERHDVETKLVSAARAVALVGLQRSSSRPWERGRRPVKRRTTKSYKKVMFTRNIIILFYEFYVLRFCLTLSLSVFLEKS